MESKGNRFSVEEIYDARGGEVLHKVVRLLRRQRTSNEYLSRIDLSNENEYLQLATIEIPSGHVFKPHVHLERVREFTNLRAQESWVVLEGSVEVEYFDEDGKSIGTRILEVGDCSITFRGGHGYRSLHGNAVVYEFKSGPYEGQLLDKRFL